MPDTFLPSLGDRIAGPLDIIFVTGDAYIDHPSMGVALLGRYLERHGFSVGVIGQPDITSDRDIGWFGAPRLFWAVTAGAVDSMVANYTASGRKRRSDDYTPGGEGGRRPDRAVVVYANLIRRYFKEQRIVIGGIEASLRRLAHYDWWQDRVKRSVLLDAKADLLVFGMGERTLLEIARRARGGMKDPPEDLPGICYRTSTPGEGVMLPSFDEVAAEKAAFHRFFTVFSDSTKRLIQPTGNTFVVQNPPAAPLKGAELDEVYAASFARDVHPHDAKEGRVNAIEMVRFSITSHRGCFGACHFCSLTAHHGTAVTGRSEASILAEAKELTRHPKFRGTISDIGGPSANMYGMTCERPGCDGTPGNCGVRDCLLPRPCPSLSAGHDRYLDLLDRVAKIPGVKHVFVTSGLRHDLLVLDPNHEASLARFLARHVSGQMKIAPEHNERGVLTLMGKAAPETFESYRAAFDRTRGKNQHFVCYFLAAHPGATLEDDRRTGEFIRRELGYEPEQVQIFTPTPSTWSTTMYHTGLDREGRPIFVERNLKKRVMHKEAIMGVRSKE